MVSNCLFTSFTISMAAIPTDFMVIAENQYGSILPMSKNAKTTGLSMLTPFSRTFDRVTNAAVKANDTNAAEPMRTPYRSLRSCYRPHLTRLSCP